MDKFDTISLEDVKNLLGDRKAERWFLDVLQTLKQRNREEIQLLRLPENSIEDGFHRLFFSEPKMLQFYYETRNLPLLNIENNAKLALLTPLPDDLLELEPKTFWKKWVCFLF